MLFTRPPTETGSAESLSGQEHQCGIQQSKPAGRKKDKDNVLQTAGFCSREQVEGKLEECVHPEGVNLAEFALFPGYC